MAKFSDLLRGFRQACNDPDRLNRRLSQERLGELIGHEMGDLGFSGAAVSDWERGESKINAQDRNVLIALIQVLHKCGGLQTLAEANQLLEVENYRGLNADEEKKVFRASASDLPVQPAFAEPMENKPGPPSLIGNFLFETPQEFQSMLAKARAGPPPAWPRVIVEIFRRFSDRLSASRVWTFILWIWIWLIAWWLITPSLRWPFSSRDEALLAVVIYAFGAIIIPALIGALTNTKDNEFWQEKKSVKELNIRLYTHQGASIGFHVGYFFVFLLSLLRYNLGLQPVTWLELIIMAFPIILGYASARLIPYNLLLAYKRLSLRDGAIFFVFFLFGPAWGYFFLESYDILLTQTLGVIVFLLATTIIVGQTAWQNRRKAKTVENENSDSKE